MIATNRRGFLWTVASGSGLVVASNAMAAAGDGTAAGYDVNGAADFLPTIPRKSGDAMVFTADLDKGPIKATSGGWAREITTRGLPIATGIAGAHLYLNAGGSREMHWHNSAELAYVIDGRCQATVVDPEGVVEVLNLGPGDLWYFAKGHSHAIQTLGDAPCHAILAFDDGLYSEHGTFGLSDFLSRYDSRTLAAAFGGPSDFYETLPKGETYIEQGRPIPLDGPQAQATRRLDSQRTHLHALTTQEPRLRTPGGEFYVASKTEFPASATMTATFLRLREGALYAPHWHSEANEWQYVLKGRARFNLFGPDKRMASAELSPGQCAYLPSNCGHSIQNTGSGDAEIVGVFDSGSYQESTLSDWLASAPRHLLANNFGVLEGSVIDFAKRASLAAAEPIKK